MSITEVNKIQEDWEVVRLGDACEKIKSGGTPLTSKTEFYGGEIKFVKIEDLTNSKKYLSDTIAAITETGLNNSNAWLVPENSVLIGIYGSLGATAINKVPVATNQAILGIIPDKKRLNEEFLYYFFLSSKNIFLRQAKHTTQANLTLEIIENLKIPLPPLPEQKKIASVLSTVDEAVQKVDEAIAKTKRLKKGLMQELLTRGIGHERFKFSKELGCEIPGEWGVSELYDIGTFQYGYTASAKDVDTGIKFLRITDIKGDGTVDWDHVPYCSINSLDYEKYELKEGDILFARIGATAGKTSYIDRKVRGIFASYLIRFQTKESIDSKYVFYFTQSNLYWSQAYRQREGQLKKGMNANTLSKLKIAIPNSKTEQQKIAEILSTIDKKLELERQRKEKLERIKRGLMNDLLTGRKRVEVS